MLREVIVDGKRVNWTSDPEWVSVNLLTYTDQSERGGKAREAANLPPHAPDEWVENASIRITDHGVQVAISVNDPRGGFQMELRKTDDGTIYMHVPQERASEPHAPIAYHHEGTYVVYEEPQPVTNPANGPKQETLASLRYLLGGAMQAEEHDDGTVTVMGERAITVLPDGRLTGYDDTEVTSRVNEEPERAFNLRIALGNDVMQQPVDVAWALRDLAQRLDAAWESAEFGDDATAFPGSGIARDVNGNTVGRWEAN